MGRTCEHKAFECGIETYPKGVGPARHRHANGYASVVLRGTFVEAGFAGRIGVAPGDVLLHGRFDCHVNTSTCSRSVQILRLPWRNDDLEGHFRVPDPDLLARLAEDDPEEAAIALAENAEAIQLHSNHWTQQLAADLQRVSSVSLRQWAEKAGMRPEALSRGFHREFAVSPKQFRLETRARSAWREILKSTFSLTTIAHDFGFSDLAHLSRSVRFLTGFPPSFWRGHARNSVQAQRPKGA